MRYGSVSLILILVVCSASSEIFISRVAGFENLNRTIVKNLKIYKIFSLISKIKKFNGTFYDLRCFGWTRLNRNVDLA